MAIVHKTFKNDAVQSLRYGRVNGQQASVGVAAPGKYDFGIAEVREEIFAVDGVLFTNKDGRIITVSPGKGSLVFEEGEQITFSCTEHVAYHCLFGEAKKAEEEGQG